MVHIGFAIIDSIHSLESVYYMYIYMQYIYTPGN